MQYDMQFVLSYFYTKIKAKIMSMNQRSDLEHAQPTFFNEPLMKKHQCIFHMRLFVVYYYCYQYYYYLFYLCLVAIFLFKKQEWISIFFIKYSVSYSESVMEMNVFVRMIVMKCVSGGIFMLILSGEIGTLCVCVQRPTNS